MASSGDPTIEGWFPNLRSEDYLITSAEDAAYNCIAWAAGKTDAWWQAVRAPGYYWPDEAPWDDRIESLVVVFKLLGYEVCDSDAFDPDYDKVAIYGKGDTYEHAARQLPNGKWTSKLGVYKDIEHETLFALTGAEYGSIVKVLRKPISQPPVAASNMTAEPPLAT
jgi:hypothetical protein